MSDSEETPIIETANGNFYGTYKRNTLEFLDFVRRLGEDGVRSGKLLPEDLDAVQRGLSTIQRQGGELFPLLAKLIDESSPSFWDECVVENIWSLCGAVFLIAQHSGITRSAKAFLAGAQTHEARNAKKPADAEKARKQKEALIAVLKTNDFSHPYRLADSIFDFPKEQAKLKRAAERLGIKSFSKSTAERLLVQMRDSASS